MTFWYDNDAITRGFESTCLEVYKMLFWNDEVNTDAGMKNNRPLSRRLDRCDRVIQNEGDDSIGGKV